MMSNPNHRFNNNTTSANSSSIGSSIMGISNVENNNQCCNIFGRKKNNHKKQQQSATSSINNGHNITTTPTQIKNNDINDDAAIASEMNKLSLEERNRLYDEIHGVHFFKKESDEFVTKAIAKLNAAYKGLPSSKRAAADKAFFLKPSLESNRKFKLMFLRADSYDPRKASKRLAKYFESKLELWGESKLVHPITLDDLSKEDMDAYGSHLVCPWKDNAGRSIWFSDFPRANFALPLGLLRCNWYTIMNTLEDEEAQLKGVSNIQYFVGKFHPNFSVGSFHSFMMKWSTIIPHLPVRVTSDHFCSDNQQMKLCLQIMRTALGKYLKLRVRAHFGSNVEIQYSLMQYGIVCPFIHNIDINNQNQQIDQLYQQYLNNRRIIEEQRRRQEEEDNNDEQKNANAMMMSDGDGDGDNNKNKIIATPNPQDILVGRGRPYQDYSGNQMLSELIDTKYLNSFILATSRIEKSSINMAVVRDMQQTNGSRFLERTTDGWILTNDEQARKKVNSAFRSKVAAAAAPASSKNTKKSKSVVEDDAEEGFGIGGCSNDNNDNSNAASTVTSKKKKSSSQWTNTAMLMTATIGDNSNDMQYLDDLDDGLLFDDIGIVVGNPNKRMKYMDHAQN